MPTHKSSDYKLSAVKYYLSHSKNQVKTCKIFGCSERSLMRWVDKYKSTNNITRFDGWTGVDKIKSDKNNYFEVSNISLDELINEEIFLKIDVEGAEPQVFRSALNLFHTNKIKYIMFEITYIINSTLDDEQIEMLRFLKKNGYFIYDIADENNYIEIKNIDMIVKKWMSEYSHLINRYKMNIKTNGTNIIAQKSPFIIK